jgi:hypothetical protein
LTVVLFFLVDILGFQLEPNTNGGRQLLWCSEATPHEQWKKTKDLRSQTHTDTKGRSKAISQQWNSQKPIPFTSVGRPPFIGRRMDFLHTEIALV